MQLRKYTDKESSDWKVTSTWDDNISRNDNGGVTLKMWNRCTTWIWKTEKRGNQKQINEVR